MFVRAGRVGAFVGAAAMALGGLSACGGDESPGPEAAGGGAPSQIQDEGARQEGTIAGEATMSEVLENPSRFYGQQVVVSGAVGQVLVDPGAFTLGASVSEETALGDGAGAQEGDASTELLVLPTRGTQVRANEITEGDTVQVTGTICAVTAQIQSEQYDVDFLFEEDAGVGAGGDAGFLQQFQDQPGVFATQVDATVRDEGDGPAPGTMRTTGQQGGGCPSGTGGGNTGG